MNIYILMGKSATGKDTLYKKLLEDVRINFKPLVTYTTRPIREGEKDGVEYFFKTKEEYEKISKKDIIEERCYKTIHGDWYYYMIKDNQININSNDKYLLIGTLPTFLALKKCYGEENVIPLYIEVDDEIRLTRAITREKQQKEPNYEELCRRFLADAKDFNDDKLKEAGIKKKYNNFNIEECVKKIINDIPEHNNMIETIKRIINNFECLDDKNDIINFFKNLQIGQYFDNDYLTSKLFCSKSYIYMIVYTLQRLDFLDCCYRHKVSKKIINVKDYNNDNLVEYIDDQDFISLVNELLSKPKTKSGTKNWEQIWQVNKL